MARVAFASGFGSVRRFNTVFARRFGRPPSSIRRALGENTGADEGSLSLRLDFRPPIAWESLLAFLSRRAVPGVERVTLGTYERSVSIDETTGWLRARLEGDHLRLLVSLSLVPHVGRVVRGVRDLFDLDASPRVVSDTLIVDRTLAPIVRKTPGLRVPGSFDAFEVAVRSVLAQQISVAGATTLSGRIAQRFGRVVEDLPAGLDRISPRPIDLARAPIAAIRAIGMPESRARTVQLLARAVEDGSVDLGSRTEPSRTVLSLRAIPGIGPFTAQVIAMRVLQDPDAFPENDLIVLRRLGKDSVRRAERWRPFRAYGVLYLWESEGDK